MLTKFGEQVLDLNTGILRKMDYKTGTHGFLDIAKALPDSVDREGGYMIIAATVPANQGTALIRATTSMQRRWRKYINLRKWRSFTTMCITLAKQSHNNKETPPTTTPNSSHNNPHNIPPHTTTRMAHLWQ